MQAAAIMLFLFLPALLAAAAVVMGLLFLREAFAPAAKRRHRASHVARLPLLAGDALHRWAAESAQRIVGRYTARRASREGAVALAHEVEADASQVIEQSLPSGTVAREPLCSDCSSQPIHVTVPEALAIVDELRRNASSREWRRIHDRAQSNLRRTSQAPTATSPATVCPLLSDDNRCAVFAARPLYCRGRCCPHCDLPGEDRWTTEVEAANQFAATFGEGVSRGLSQGLTAAGLDGRSYELNRALVQVMDAPDAAERWLRGEPVFEAPHQPA